MSTSQLSLETRLYSLSEGSMRYRILRAHSSGWKPVHVYSRPLCTGWRFVSVSVEVRFWVFFFYDGVVFTHQSSYSQMKQNIL